MNAHDYGKEFKEQGYTIGRGFFNQEEMNSLIEAIKAPDPRNLQPSDLNNGQLLFYNNIFLRSPKVRELLALPRLVDFLKQIIGPDFWVRWDQAVFKGPGSRAFPWHQDNAYNQLKDQHFQLWIACSKMNKERGGLWVLPGSHKHGTLPHEKKDNHLSYVGPTDNAVCVDAEVGDLVLFSSRMLHYTGPNISTHDRWAYVAELMSLDHLDPYMKPPYFVLARNGKPQPQFVRFYRGRLRLSNHLKYVVPRLQKKLEAIRGSKA